MSRKEGGESMNDREKVGNREETERGVGEGGRSREEDLVSEAKVGSAKPKETRGCESCERVMG